MENEMIGYAASFHDEMFEELFKTKEDALAWIKEESRERNETVAYVGTA